MRQPADKHGFQAQPALRLTAWFILWSASGLFSPLFAQIEKASFPQTLIQGEPTRIGTTTASALDPGVVPANMSAATESFLLPVAGVKENLGILMSLPVPPLSYAKVDGNTVLPIDWAAALQLAEVSSLDVSLAVEKVQEAQLQLRGARMQWLPNLRLGVIWLHHEGRLQLPEGQIVDVSKSALSSGGFVTALIQPQKVAIDIIRARQQVAMRNSELDRSSRQSLLDVSQAYINLVSAQAGAALAAELDQHLRTLYRQTSDFRKSEFLSQSEVTAVEQQVFSIRVSFLNTLSKQEQAGARLAMLLNLQTGVKLFSADAQLFLLQIVDEKTPVEFLVNQALKDGPGVNGIRTTLALLDEQERNLRRISLLPSVGVDLHQGVFGGGEGGTYRDFNGRTDVGVNVFWDAGQILSSFQQSRQFQLKQNQASLELTKLNNQLKMGVEVYVSQALRARESVQALERQIALAQENYVNLYKVFVEQPGKQVNTTQLLQALAPLTAARSQYIQVVSDYNNAQVQLLFLLGLIPDSHALQPLPYRQVQQMTPQNSGSATPTRTKQSNYFGQTAEHNDHLLPFSANPYPTSTPVALPSPTESMSPIGAPLLLPASLRPIPDQSIGVPPAIPAPSSGPSTPGTSSATPYLFRGQDPETPRTGWQVRPEPATGAAAATPRTATPNHAVPVLATALQLPADHSARPAAPTQTPKQQQHTKVGENPTNLKAMDPTVQVFPIKQAQVLLPQTHWRTPVGHYLTPPYRRRWLDCWAGFGHEMDCLPYQNMVYRPKIACPKERWLRLPRIYGWSTGHPPNCRNCSVTW